MPRPHAPSNPKRQHAARHSIRRSRRSKNPFFNGLLVFPNGLPPFLLPRALYVGMLMFCWINRTEPSHSTNCAPPGCVLRNEKFGLLKMTSRS